MRPNNYLTSSNFIDCTGAILSLISFNWQNIFWRYLPLNFRIIDSILSIFSMQSAGCSLRRCFDQRIRHASTSTAIKTPSSTRKRPSLISRIQANADKAAVNMLPSPPRLDREIQKLDRETGEGSLFERAAASTSELYTSPTNGKVWTQVPCA